MLEHTSTAFVENS